MIKKKMITKKQDKNRIQITMICIDDLVPQNHLLYIE